MRILLFSSLLLLASVLACSFAASPSDTPSVETDDVKLNATKTASTPLDALDGNIEEVLDDTLVRQTLCFTPLSDASPSISRLLSDAQKRATPNQQMGQKQTGQKQEAAPIADHLVEAGKAWVAQARDASDPGAYMHAGACAQLALEIDSHHVGAKNLLLMTYLNDHRFADAKKLANEILKDDATDPSAWGSLSDALLELGDVDAATAAAQKMVDLKPNLPSYARASYLSWLQNDTTAAKIYIQQAHGAGRGQRLREPEAWVITEAAKIFWHEGDLDGADAGFTLALKRQPAYPDALQGKARIALARKNFSQAISLLEESHAQKSSVATAWLLHDAYSLSGDVERALEVDAQLRKVGRNQDPRTFALYLATTSTSPEDLDASVRILRHEFEQRRGPYTKTAYAFALAKAGQAQIAQALVSDVIALNIPDAELLARLSFVRQAAGISSESAALQTRAKSLNSHLSALGASL